ncbi:MAG TPA: aminomethyltransferase family protein [Gemmatimonadaceae bacterium]|nr:aminomethyltransferase family protein [Gemmatimonadaceae bacterium]
MPNAAVDQTLKTTPFHARTAPLVRAQTWRRWAGYQVASAYEPHPDREYAAVRNAAALLDVSPLYKYRIAGPDAARLLDRMVTRDVSKCRVGQVLYTPWCDVHGKVIDDGTISRLDEHTFRLTSAEPNLRWLSMNSVGLEVSIEDVSERTGALALQGPSSRTILQHLTPADLSALKYFRLVHTTVREIPVTISRTGYTGDLGFELWVDADRATALWDALIEAGTPYGITPAGIWALDLARIEAGLVMLDVDYYSSHRAVIEDQKSSPFELNLAWTVSADKGPYNGRRALRAEHARGPAWGFVGLDVDWESLERIYAERGLPPHLPTVAWRTSAPVYKDGKQIGYATSGCWSPLLKKYLALGHLVAPHFQPGAGVELEVTVEHRRKRARAVVRKLPFFDPPRKKA